MARFNSRTPGGVRRYLQGIKEGVFTRFNSRTPGGVRRGTRATSVRCLAFQFTHPGRGATSWNCSASTLRDWFQFTHPGRGATFLCHTINYYYGVFQFTHPGRGATTASDKGWTINYVSIHAPREGCDPVLEQWLLADDRFQFTHPGRGATWRWWRVDLERS